MKKFLFLLLTFFVLVGCFRKVVEEKPKLVGMANPWTDCNEDLVKASKIAGFTFSLSLSKYTVRAMKSMIEIKYHLDEFRTVCVRKTDFKQYANKDDISGVYIEYPVNKEIILNNSIPIKIRGTQDKIYVMNIAISNVYYSAYCKEGMNLQEVERIYNIIVQTETAY